MARAIDRARKDIDEGRLWIARDRRAGYLAAHPSDQTALTLLGEVYFAMGDLPAAGRFWFLTERDDADTRAAISALRERHRKSTSSLAEAVPAYAEMGDWPASVQARLEALKSEVESRGWPWFPTRKPNALRAEKEFTPPWWDPVVPFLLLGGVVVPWLIGCGAIVVGILWLLGAV